MTPAPETSEFVELLKSRERGKLKVYIGSAAGVGKTYRMLQEAHDLRRRGIDVVVGFVETHGRAETQAKIGGLEQVPLRRIEYRDVTLTEMDLDAVLTRKPQVALVDELAHTNAAGSRHPKRYHDVQELLDAGDPSIVQLGAGLDPLIRRQHCPAGHLLGGLEIQLRVGRGTAP